MKKVLKFGFDFGIITSTNTRISGNKKTNINSNYSGVNVNSNLSGLREYNNIEHNNFCFNFKGDRICKFLKQLNYGTKINELVSWWFSY